MPSIRKRIGYLPSINAQETIFKIANKENLSQSKVVVILIEEALTWRSIFELQSSNDLSKKNLYRKENHLDNISITHNDVDELISDKGITYDTKKYSYNSDYISSKSKENFNEELFEQFKQFIMFQKMIQNKQ